jgi:hypothetical protein
MYMLGHDDPSMKLESEAGAGEKELLCEDVFGLFIVKVWETMVAREGEESCMIRYLVAM